MWVDRGSKISCSPAQGQTGFISHTFGSLLGWATANLDPGGWAHGFGWGLLVLRSAWVLHESGQASNLGWVGGGNIYVLHPAWQTRTATRRLGGLRPANGACPGGGESVDNCAGRAARDGG